MRQVPRNINMTDNDLILSPSNDCNKLNIYLSLLIKKNKIKPSTKKINPIPKRINLIINYLILFLQNIFHKLVLAQ